jgi:SAM-dependent methyltransferase
MRMLSILLLAAALCVPGADPRAQKLPPVPYVSTPYDVVDKMLAMAKVGPADVVYDLGCGDGRIVIVAAKLLGARGVGIDLSPERIAEANAMLEATGMKGRVKFIRADLFKSDFSEATVVTLYLGKQVNAALRPQLWRQLKVGTRVVSHAFDMGPEWPHEASAEVDGRIIYMWTITEKQKRVAPK